MFCDKLEYIHRNSFSTNGVIAQQAEGLLIESGDTLTVSTSEGRLYHVSLPDRYTHYPEHEMIDFYRLLNTGEEDGHDENS